MNDRRSTDAANCLQSFDFKTLFIEELGWDRPRGRTSTWPVDEQHVSPATPIAEKRGVVGLSCMPGRSADAPDLRRAAQDRDGRSPSPPTST